MIYKNKLIKIMFDKSFNNCLFYENESKIYDVETEDLFLILSVCRDSYRSTTFKAVNLQTIKICTLVLHGPCKVL